MEKTQNGTAFLLALVGLAFAVGTAHAEFLIHPSEDYSLDPETGALSTSLGLYSTSTNYNSQGQSSTPVGFQKLSRMRASGWVGYSVLPKLTVFGQLEWVRNSITTSSTSASGYGLGDQMVGAAYRIVNPEGGSGGMHLAVQFRLDIPAYDNTKSATDGTPYLGDGSMDFTPSLALWLPVGTAHERDTGVSAAVGYQARGEGFSKSIPWHAQIRSRPKMEGLLYAAGVKGAQSMSSDALSGSTSLTSSAGGGGSALIHAINPSIVNLVGTLGYQLTSASALELAITKSVVGRNSPVGTEFALGYSYRWHSEPSARSEHRRGDAEFVSHSLEAKVLRANDRLNLVRIDKGSADGVEVGQVFDLFENPEVARTTRPIARAKVVSVKSEEAALSVSEYYREVWIDEGFVAKRLVQ